MTFPANILTLYPRMDESRSRRIYPADVVLFEGILVLYDPSVRDMLHMKLFVDTDSDTRLARRGEVLWAKRRWTQSGVLVALHACTHTHLYTHMHSTQTYTGRF